MEPIVRIDDMTFEYAKEEGGESILAVDHLSLEIARGDFVAVIGRNGSGKSTLAKNMNALLLPSGGAVYINGYNTKEESKIWEIRQTAGMVFQNPDNQIVSAVVEDDVAFGPENLGVDPEEIRVRVDDSLISVDMYENRKKAPHLLSGGQKQRIAIAGVIAMRPECIILDEPTAMLDPQGRKEVLRLIHKLHAENITVVLITHYMEEAAQADRVIIMDQGKVILDDVPSRIFAEVATIKEIGLTVPLAAELSHRLRGHGFNVPKNIITTEEMVDYLCQLK